jgi:hypothetical protein
MTGTAKRVTEGGCLCGRVRYRAHGEPIWVGHCHCHSCRRHTGSLVATFVGFSPEQVEWTGEPRRIHQSSPGVQRGFCDHCGTPISYESDRFPGETHLYLGTLDHPERLQAQFHVFHAERVPWFHIDDDLPRYPGTSDEG